MVIPTAIPSADSEAGMSGAVKAALFRNHSGGQAINPGSTRAEPSYLKTPSSSLTHRHGNYLD